jgi:butyryl-CoA dehydrogenase
MIRVLPPDRGGKDRAVRAELDETGEFPWRSSGSCQSDMLGLYIPEEYGGLGKGCLSSALLSKNCPLPASVYHLVCGQCARNLPILLQHGSENMKKKYLRIIAAGQELVAFGLRKRMRAATLAEFRQPLGSTATTMC